MTERSPFPELPLKTKPVLGVSACLLGQEVRYDGRHKRDAWLCEALGPWADFVPLCPEVAIGMGVPRPPIRLVRTAGRIRALGVDVAGIDVGEALRAYGEARVAALPEISGYVFKKNSPSCGLEAVPLYSPEGALLDEGSRGLYAKVYTRLRPELPVIDEEGLHDPARREAFLWRVGLLHAWYELRKAMPGALGLRQYHRQIHRVLQGREPRLADALTQLLAAPESAEAETAAARYLGLLMAGLCPGPERVSRPPEA